MGCFKLIYHPEFLHLSKGAAPEKSDHETVMPHGKKDAGDENCVDYYPFGLTFNSYSRENSVANNYLYNKKELISDLGLNVYDFGWREFDPAIGRWSVVDQLAEKRYWLSPYNFVQDNPINRFDPDGLTDFTLDKKTGAVAQAGKANDQPDRILKTDKNGNVQKKGEGFLGFLVRASHKGEAKVAVGGIQQGILKDGQNFKTQNNLIEVGGKGQPTEKGVESFAFKLTNYIGKEIAGSYFSNDGKNTSAMTIGMYKDNKYDQSGATGHVLGLQQGLSLTGFFHTHPGENHSDPSERDRTSRDNALQKMPNLNFSIITQPDSYGDEYKKVDYTHN